MQLQNHLKLVPHFRPNTIRRDIMRVGYKQWKLLCYKIILIQFKVSHKMQDMPNHPLSFFTDPLLLNYITEFLHIRECLLLSALSKKIRFVMQDHFRSIILQNNLYFIPGKSSIHQMHFYFDRCLRIFKYTKENEHKEEVKMGHGKKQADKKKKKSIQEQPEPPFNDPRQVLKTTVQNPFKFKVVTYFQVGPVFACCLDNKDKAYIFKTHHLISQAETKEKAIYIEQSDVADIKCKAEKLILVKTYGEAYLYQANKLSKEMQFAKSIINWSLNIPVKHVYSSYSYTLFQLQQPHCSRNFYFKHLFNYNIDLTQQHNEEDNHFMYVIVLNMHNYAYYLVKVTGKILESVAIGNKEIFIVNQKYQTLVVQMEHIHQGVKQLVTKPFQPFIGKKIIRVDSGYNFFFALERNVEYIEEWTFEEVAIWLRKVGFGDFSKIARAQKLDGKTLKTIQRKYMENVLGLTKLNMQQKLILCIEEVVEGKNEYDQLWVWGKNEYGQLGMISANYIAHPLRIKMDFLQNDRIDKVFCGWQQSFIRTHRGKIYCSLMASERKKKKVVEEKQKEDCIFSDQDDFRKEGRETDDTYHFKNKKRKRTQDYREEFKKVKGHHKRHEEEQRWLQSRSGKAFFVSAYKDYVFIVQCPVQHKFQPTKQKKLRTSKAIIDKIIWSDGLDKSQFKIGIIDKEMGTIEVTPFQIQTFDYKQTSVRYVKKNNVIVWDRELKIDHL